MFVESSTIRRLRMDTRFENFTFRIIKLYKLVNRIKVLEMKEFGLKSIHVMCIYDLFVHGKMTASELTKLTLEDKGAISRALKMLLENGYVTYDSDGYNSPVALTDFGVSVAEAIVCKAQRAVDAAGGTLTEGQRTNFYECLEIVSKRLEEYYKSMTENGNE